MTIYQIEEERGVFVVTETKPQIIAQFMDAGHAQFFLAALEQGFSPSAILAAEPEAPAAPEPPAAPEAPRAPEPPAAPELPAPPAAKGYKRDGPREVRTEAQLDADYRDALVRIKEGEKCGDVASDMNLPFATLRAKRAAQVRLEKAEVAERPDKVARKPAQGWTTDIDLDLLDARDDPKRLQEIAEEIGRRVSECTARIEALMKDAQRSMAG